MSAFGVLCGMTLPMLCLPTAFIGALGLVLVPKLAEGAALGQPGSGAAPGRPLHAGHLGADPPRHGLSGGAGPHPGRRPVPGAHRGPLLFSPCPSGCSCPATSPSSPAPSTAWAGRGPPPATPSSAAWCSSAVPSSSWACPAWDSGAMWRAFVASRRPGGTPQLDRAVRRATGLRAQIFQWCTAPALSALLMGLVIDLLFQVLLPRRPGGSPRRPGLPAVRRRALPGRPPGSGHPPAPPVPPVLKPLCKRPAPCYDGVKLKKERTYGNSDWNRRRGHHGGHRRPACGGLSGPGGALYRRRRVQPHPGGLPAAVHPARA